MPLNEREYLLQCLSEECSEVAQRISKALRFTPEEIQSGQPLTNAARITEELVDLQGVVEMLVEAGVIQSPSNFPQRVQDKKDKVEFYMKYSRERGCLV